MTSTKRTASVIALTAAATLAASATALGAATGSGASFPAQAYSKWCQDTGYCSYTSKGSTGGINDLINGVVDFAASDAPLSADQTAALAARRGGVTPLYFPTLLGAIAVSANVDGVSKNLRIDGPVLADIFRGAVTSWNDARIRASNPGVSLPASPITLCVRSDGSGTSFGFSSYLSKVSRDFRTSVGASQLPNWPTSGVVKGARNPGVAQCVKSNSNAIGYTDVADARDAGLTRNFVAVGKRERVRGRQVAKYILPSIGATTRAANIKKVKPDLTVSLTASSARGAYPIAITTWIIAYSDYGRAGKSSQSRDAVKQVLNYVYSSPAQASLTALRFAPLTPVLAAAGKAQIRSIR